MAEILLVKCWMRSKTHLSMVPPLGIMYLASTLRQAGHNVRIFRWLDDPAYRKKLDALLHDTKPDIIGVSAIVPEFGAVRTLLAHLQKTDPSIPVIVGGHLASANPVTTLNVPGVRAICFGEGEKTTLELVDAIMEGRTDLENIAGVGVLKDKNLIRGPARTPLTPGELDELPFPAWDLIDLDELFSYRSMASVGRRRYMQVATSRGCPYRCVYCHGTMGRVFRTRTPQRVLEEIRILREQYDIHEFEITDDCFNLQRERMHTILEGLIAFNDPKLRLQFPNGLRSDLLNQEDIDLLRKAGTDFIAFAIETATPRLQKYIKKNLDITKAVHAIDMASRAGIFCNGFFMLGFPTETRQEAQATVDLAVSTSLHEALFFKVNPFKGTELFEMVANASSDNEDGHNRGDALAQELDDLDYFSVTNNISDMTDSEFSAIYTQAYRRFYLDPVRVVRTFFRHPRKSQIVMYGIQVAYKFFARMVEWARKAKVDRRLR